MESHPLFDPSVLDSLKKYGPIDQIWAMVDLYLATAPAQMAELRAMADKEDWNAVRFQAHSMGSGSGSLGVSALHRCLHGIEDRCKRSDIDGARSLLEGLDELLLSSCDALREYRNAS